MKRTIRPVRNSITPFAATFFVLLLSFTAPAAQLAVNLTGGFTNQNVTVYYTDGSYDVVNMSATVSLVFSPPMPTCNGTNFVTSSAQVNGSIVVWGSDTEYDPGPVDSVGFSNVYNYINTQISPSITYAGDGSGSIQKLTWNTGLSAGPDKAAPNSIEYDGSSQTLEFLITPPSPFQSDEDYYEASGTATVSGQTSVYSCLDGTVTDSNTGKPVSNAQVTFGGVGDTTASDGTFNYQGIPANIYLLTVSGSGYLPYSNLLTIPPFTIVQQPIALGAQLSVLDANPLFLGFVFWTGANFPLSSSDPKTPTALTALAQANVVRQGMVADGITQLLIRYVSAAPGTVSFTHSNSAAGTLSCIDSSLAPVSVATTSLAGEQMACALLTAPDYINASSLSDLIQVTFQPSGSGGQSVSNSVPITIKRAPALLVHGLWSSAKDWPPLENLLINSGFQGSTIDYSHWYQAAGPFAAYRGMVMNAASNQVNQVRKGGFADTRCDVVGHSMGGILTRLDANNSNFYTFDNYYQSYIRRIITIDTPHYGSRGATVLQQLAENNGLFNFVLNTSGHPTGLGGVADLDPLTFAQSVAGNANVKIAATPLPGVAISCTVSTENDLPFTKERLIYFLAKLAFLPNSELQQSALCGQSVSLFESEIGLANQVFTASSGALTHDGIVSSGSQIGDCAVSFAISDVAHTAAPGNSLVDAEVVSLLSGDSIVFAHGFPAVTTADLQSQICTSGSGTGSSPTPALLINLTVLPDPQPGATVSCTVQSVPGSNVEDMVIIAAFNGSVLTNAEATNLPYTFTFTAPTNALGLINISALANNSQNQIDLEQTNLLVQTAPGTNLQSITVNPPGLLFTGIGQVSDLTLTGGFSDGSSLDITSSGSGTAYSSTAPSVAMVDSNGVITAVGQGTATIQIGFGSITTNIPVQVSLQPPLVQSTTPLSVAAGSISVPFTLVGSSLGGASQIQFLRKGVPDSGLSVSNLSAGAGGLNLTGLLSVKTNAAPGLRTVVVTTPGGSSSSSISTGNRLFVGTPVQINDVQIMQTSTNGPFIHLHILGPPGSICVLQASSNLLTWSPLATNALLGGDWYFDKYLTNGQKALFYRASAPAN